MTSGTTIIIALYTMKEAGSQQKPNNCFDLTLRAG